MGTSIRRPGRHVPVDINKLASAIADSGLSRAEVARKCGVSRAAITQILSGSQGVSADLFERLVFALDVAPSALRPDCPADVDHTLTERCYHIEGDCRCGDPRNPYSERFHQASDTPSHRGSEDG